ncbi:hypothetical protein ACH5RR_016605 [Cinchona calisaya]|uniref:Cystatin domain-containing protein n=1 Tax=Cinchona calisaya TaxID=153742 RepID=A0ABD2ZWD3_9GENT
MLSAHNLRATAAAAAKTRAALSRGFCSSSFSSSPTLQAEAGGPTVAATSVPPPNIPDCGAPCPNAIIPPINLPWTNPRPEKRIHFGPYNFPDPANDPSIISIADYAVQQFNEIQQDTTQYKLVKILEANITLVAGVIYRVILELSDDGAHKKYRFDVWEKPWLKFRKLRSWEPVD